MCVVYSYYTVTEVHFYVQIQMNTAKLKQKLAGCLSDFRKGLTTGQAATLVLHTATATMKPCPARRPNKQSSNQPCSLKHYPLTLGIKSINTGKALWFLFLKRKRF